MEPVKKIPVTVPEMVSIIKDAKELINTPEKWGKGASAFDKNGNPVSYKDAKACAFCATGAIQLAILRFITKNKDKEVNLIYLYDLFPIDEFYIWPFNMKDKGPQIVELNDSIRTSYEMIIFLFDETIKRNL